MNTEKNKTITEFVAGRNASKQLFTAGPASLLEENIAGLMPCFGRGDEEYASVEENVLDQLKKLSGHRNIARMQGSASLALEVMTLNYLEGNVLVVDTGYYSARMKWLSEAAMRKSGRIKNVQSVHWKDLTTVTGNYDWLVACSVETSCGLKIDISILKQAAKKINASLMLDATASIGLENNHHLADVIAYSSCKGLFGLTGASFIAFNEIPGYEADSFYLNLTTHLEKRMTGPYHAIASLYFVLPKHNEFREAVKVNKEKFLTDFAKWVVTDLSKQPLLCTYVDCKISTDNNKAVLYKPRSDLRGSVVCHLGEVHLGVNARGNILHSLKAENF